MKSLGWSPGCIPSHQQKCGFAARNYYKNHCCTLPLNTMNKFHGKPSIWTSWTWTKRLMVTENMDLSMPVWKSKTKSLSAIGKMKPSKKKSLLGWTWQSATMKASKSKSLVLATTCVTLGWPKAIKSKHRSNLAGPLIILGSAIWFKSSMRWLTKKSMHSLKNTASCMISIMAITTKKNGHVMSKPKPNKKSVCAASLKQAAIRHLPRTLKTYMVCSSCLV